MGRTNFREAWDDNPLQMLEIPTDQLIINEILSGRSEYKRDPKKVKETADSIRQVGQIEPAVVGLDDVGNPVLYVGFGRYEAQVQNGLPLLCRYSPVPLEDVLELGMHENLKREPLSPVQIMDNILRLNEKGLKDKEVADRIGVSPAFVSVHKRLALKDENDKPKFSKWALQQIHKGTVPAKAAFPLADLANSEEIDVELKTLIAAAEEAAKGTGKAARVSETAAREVVRKRGTKKKGKKGSKKAAGGQRSMKQLKTLLEAWTGPAMPEPVKLTVSAVLDYIEGTIDEDAATKRAERNGAKFSRTAKAA